MVQNRLNGRGARKRFTSKCLFLEVQRKFEHFRSKKTSLFDSGKNSFTFPETK